MSLRTRLILAFLLLSVVPLTAVTASHYVSSLDALHRVATREAEQMTQELGQRMELVKGDLSRRVETLWADTRPQRRQAPRPAPRQRPDAQMTSLSGVTAEALGNAVQLLERIEFRTTAPEVMTRVGTDVKVLTKGNVPAVARVPAPGRVPAPPSAPPAPPASGPSAAAGGAATPSPVSGPAVPPPPSEPLVIDIKTIAAELEKHGVKMGNWTPEAEKAMADGIGLGMAAAARGIRAGQIVMEQRARAEQARVAQTAVGDATARHDEVARDEQRRQNEAAQRTHEAIARQVDPGTAHAAHAAFRGEGLDVTMQRDGKPVGTVNAKVRLDRVLSTVVSNTRREEGEIAFAIDPKGVIVADTPGDRAIVEGLGVRRDSAGFMKQDGWIIVMRDDPAGSGARFGIARRIGDSVRDLRVAAGRDLGVGLGVIGLALVGIFPISGRLTKNLRRLHAGVDELAHGNYAARVDVKSKDEVGRLSEAFNKMAADIESHQRLAVEQERLKRELELCRQIQNDMLPREPFHAAFADIKGISLPAREVGGDFFNYFTMGAGDLAVLVGDVSGKGVSAALTMANVQATLKARLPLMANLAELVDSIDREFEKSSPRGVYATLFAGVLDRNTRTLRYVNAGHHPQFVLRVDGSIVRLPSTGLPIGLLPGQGYVTKEIALNEGDLLFFYTDGAVETENDKGDMFGAERLEALLIAAHNDGIDAVLERAESAVRAFRGAAEPFDDATMMALRVGK